jgi:hypothetical protein
VRARQTAVPEKTRGTETTAEKMRKQKRVWTESEISRGTASMPTSASGSATPMAAAAWAVLIRTASAGKREGRSWTSSAPSVSPNMLMETATNAR